MEAGYNNILKLAASGMKFGKNDGVNYVKPAASKPEVIASKPEVIADIYLLAVTLIGGSLISKFIV